ncbi:uncharacterized protein [Musca autumnalis]|uniref:uncharacterized protein n=1 Tax=Musca autumnalis TaxID=221902 RepID=UPI003CF4151E
MPAVLLKILLIMAGIEQNPGPTSTEVTICSVCHTRITRNLVQFQCSQCLGWCHLRRCSGLASHRDYTDTFVASCCGTPPAAGQATTRGRTATTSTVWRCSVCSNIIWSNIASVRCNRCNNWCHLRRCTNLRSHRDWSEDFVADCCANSTIASSTPTSTSNTTNSSHSGTLTSMSPISTLSSPPSNISGHCSISIPPQQQQILLNAATQPQNQSHSSQHLQPSHHGVGDSHSFKILQPSMKTSPPELRPTVQAPQTSRSSARRSLPQHPGKLMWP